MNGKTRKALVSQATLMLVALVAAQSASGALQYSYVGSIEGAASADVSGYQFFGVAADPQGRVYASDWTIIPPATLRARVKVFSGINSPGGPHLLGMYGHYNVPPVDPGDLYVPMAIALDASGRLFVADYLQSAVHVFSAYSNTSALFKFGEPGAGAGQFLGIYGLSFDQRNRLYVSELLGSRVQVFADTSSPPAPPPTYSPDAEINASVTGGSFMPYSMAVDSVGNIYVSDLSNSMVKILTPTDGTWTNYQYSGSIDLSQSGLGMIVPFGIAVDSSDRVHVLVNGDRLLAFSSRRSGNTLLAMTGSRGSGPGQFNGALSIDAAGGLVYVGETGNSRIQAFTLGESSDPGGVAPTKEASAMTLRIDRVKKKKPKKKPKPRKKKKSTLANLASKKSGNKPLKEKKKKRKTNVAKVGFRGRVKLSGKLTYEDGRALANKKVSLYVRSYRPGASDHKVKDLTTKPDGRFSYKYRGGESKKITVRFKGDARHEAVSKKVTYIMKDSVTLKAKKVGEKIYRLSGKVRSAHYQYRRGYQPYKLVEISFRKPGGVGSRIYRVLRANRKTGRFKTLVTPRYEGKQLFRARAIEGYAGAYRDGRSRWVIIWPSKK